MIINMIMVKWESWSALVSVVGGIQKCCEIGCFSDKITGCGRCDSLEYEWVYLGKMVRFGALVSGCRNYN